MEKIKTATIGLLSAIVSAFGVLIIPVLLLVFCNVTDYATGIVASKYRNEPIDSYKGARGIFKKVAMWLLICVGVVIDQLIAYTIQNIGITLPFNFLVGCIVAIWLVCNEIISILENINDIGVPLPPFLMPIVSRLKSKVEEAGKIDEGGDSDE
ncbi:MAG: holin family protein [Lachnospiraceae bacterium]